MNYFMKKFAGKFYAAGQKKALAADMPRVLWQAGKHRGYTDISRGLRNNACDY
jgi:hypothetical protein